MDRLLCCSLLLLSGLLCKASAEQMYDSTSKAHKETVRSTTDIMLTSTTRTTAKRGNDSKETPITFSTSMTSSPTQHTAGSIPTTAFSHLTFSTKDIRSIVTTPGNTRDTKPTSQWTISTSSRSNNQATTSTSKATTSRPVLTAATARSTASATSRGTPSGTEGVATTSPAPGKSLVLLAFGVMSFILILIVVMVVLVTAVNLRGQCSSTKEDGKKSCDSVVLESNLTSGEKESITLVSMKTINTETDTDSPQISSIHSTTLDNEDQELGQDLLNTKMV